MERLDRFWTSVEKTDNLWLIIPLIAFFGMTLVGLILLSLVIIFEYSFIVIPISIVLMIKIIYEYYKFFKERYSK